MDRKISLNFDPYKLPSPSFVVDEEFLENNLKIFDYIQKKTQAKILLALKGFAMFSVFPLLRKTLYGICASTVHEARLGRQMFQKEVHTFQTAYSENDLKEVLELSDHVIFNSFSQWNSFQKIIKPYLNKVEFGIRVNPEHSEVPVPLYDPCARYSRLGAKIDHFKGQSLENIKGLHFHTLCEQDSYALERTLKVFEEKFKNIIPEMKWINFGGGHHITRNDYDIDHLCSLINNFKEKYNKEIYLEPGEAIVLNAGFFVTTVLDIIENEKMIAILDSSVPCHLPDVIEMPYRPEIIGAGKQGEFKFDYRIGGQSCLAGDILGDYSFADKLKIGDRLVLLDMAHYTMVKTNTFNGIKLPSIILVKKNKKAEIIKEFNYSDFKNRLS
ncbi:MAG: carboxynorspermidine decarboxylase [Spirochaetes bacterium]|nr:carboxynorspermidine decarboxylase [Spirochaetota bacterium]